MLVERYFPVSPRLSRFAAFAAISLLSTTAAVIAAAPLTVDQPVVLPGTHGKFDFIEVDQQTGCLLASHTGNKSLDIIDDATGKLIKSVPVGAAQAVAVDADGQKYWASVSAVPKLAGVDAKTLAQTSETPLAGPADLVAYDTRSKQAYVCHDDGTDVWVVDVGTSKVVATVTIPAGPEGIVYDAGSDRVYLAIKPVSLLTVIDPSTNQIVQKWSTGDAVNPHGMVIDGAAHRAFIAGGHGTLAMMDLNTGKVLATAKIAQHVDQIAMDAGLGNIYCASGTGVVSTVHIQDAKLESLDDTPSHAGAHSIAVDQKSHAVWIAYADGDKSCVQSFHPAK